MSEPHGNDSFHDEFLWKSFIPISLIRWEMTGEDDGIQHFGPNKGR